jgi:hypothetical protein
MITKYIDKLQVNSGAVFTFYIPPFPFMLLTTMKLLL